MSQNPSAGGVPVQIVLRPYASALPMAGFAFGVGNVLYSSLLLGWIPLTEARTVAMMLLAFAAPLELFPSVLAFLSRDGNGATAFGVFGAAWAVQGLTLLRSGGTAPSPAAGIFLASLTAVLAVLCGISFRGKPLLGSLLVVAILRTICLALSNLGHQLFEKPGAIFGLIVAAFAFYGALAFLHEDTSEQISRLTLRSGDARDALTKPLDEQLDPISREVGIRRQL